MMEMPPDPFDDTTGPPDLTGWGLHCRSMYNGLVTAGFTETQALDFVVKIMLGMIRK